MNNKLLLQSKLSNKQLDLLNKSDIIYSLIRFQLYHEAYKFIQDNPDINLNHLELNIIKGICLRNILRLNNYFFHESKICIDSFVEILNNDLQFSIPYGIENVKNCTKNVVITMTTCKRIELFKKTIRSLIYNIQSDWNLIKSIVVIDDMSSEDDRKEMVEAFPFIKYIFKDEKDKGHAKSLDILFSCNEVKNSKYVFHLEDDWVAAEKYGYISSAIQVLEKASTNNSTDNELTNVVQVTINRCDGKDSDSHNLNLVGYETLNLDELNLNTDLKFNSDLKKLGLAKRIYIPKESPEYNKYFETHPGVGSVYWPYFTLRPSIIRTDALLNLLPFYEGENKGFFEFRIANKFNNLGYKSIFFNGIYFYDIGDDNNNAYKLNNHDQFNSA